MAVIVVLTLALVYGVRAGRLADRRLGELELRTAYYDDLEDSAERFGWAVDRYKVYSDHVADVLYRLQLVLTGELENVSISDYIERGIISPARDVLQEGVHEDIRISVLMPDGDRWRMEWCAGHSLEGKLNYNERIVDTLANVAYQSGEPQYWPDATRDVRFRPTATSARSFLSMLSHPIRVGAATVGVLNVISSLEDAFDQIEQSYVASVSSVIGVAVSSLSKVQLFTPNAE